MKLDPIAAICFGREPPFADGETLPWIGLDPLLLRRSSSSNINLLEGIDVVGVDVLDGAA